MTSFIWPEQEFGDVLGTLDVGTRIELPYKQIEPWSLGAGFAEVQHLRPQAQMDRPVETTLNDLTVVCANCHRMIHLGGECREMTGLVSKGAVGAPVGPQRTRRARKSRNRP
jgi:hypothetical protein